MKTRMLYPVGTLALAAIMLATLFLFGCGTQTDDTTPDASTTTAGTIKIGMVSTFSAGSVTMDAMDAVELMVAQDNMNGGLNIGGERYEVELIEYDDGGTESGEVSAVNRLVYEDEVHAIIATGTYCGAWLSETEANKVLAFLGSPTAVPFGPSYHYSYCGLCFNPTTPVTAGWFCDNYPELAENLLLVATDDLAGHMIAEMKYEAYKMFGATPTIEYFPANTVDFSSLGTKIVSLNPTCLECIAMSDETMGLAYNGAHQAGYTGQMFSIMTASTSILQKVMSAETLEGLICCAIPTEFDPPLTQVAKDFKDAWIAEYGSWTDPNILAALPYWCWRAALQNAGSIDPNEVAAVLDNGMSYETPYGGTMMVSRPDVGNDRTVDSMSVTYVKQILSGEPILLAAISLEEGYEYWNSYVTRTTEQ